MAFDLRRAEEHVRRPWRNGGGMTAEVAAWPPDADAGADFDWRVSFADVAGSGDFSTFPGVDRVITLVDGPPMRLELPGETTVLHLFAPYSFDGGVPVRCTVSGPTRDLNVMTRRGRASATVQVLELRALEAPVLAEGPAGQHPTTLLLAALDGSLYVAGARTAAVLAPGDVITTEESVRIQGQGRIAVIRLSQPAAGRLGSQTPTR
jgi:environmental stress-induced protein Ves